MNAALNPTAHPPPTNGAVLVAAVQESKAQKKKTVRLSVYRYQEGLLHGAKNIWSGDMRDMPFWATAMVPSIRNLERTPGLYYFNLTEESEVQP
jgi:hypothetical protein